MRVSSEARRRIALGASAYAGLWMVVLFSAKLPATVLLKLPPFLVAIVAGIPGPPLLLVWGGVGVWMFVIVSLLITGFCLVISRFCWRGYPDSELFGLPLLGAVVIWIGSVWLAVAVWGI